MTTITDETREATRERVAPVAELPDLPGAFAAAGKWLKANPGAMMRERPIVQMPVPDGLDHDQKLAWLEAVAESWGVKTIPDGRGGQMAVQSLGAVRFTATVCHPNNSVADFKARAAAHGIRAVPAAEYGATA